MALMVNRDAPYSGLSSLMAMQGRYGDTELVHMSKPEIQGLASLGQLTINPDTGLPEAFSLKKILPVAAGIAGSIAMPYLAPAFAASSPILAGAVGSGLGTFGGGLLAGQKPGEALLGGVTSGLMSFGIGSLLGSGAGGVTELGKTAAGQTAGEAAIQESLGTFGTDIGGTVAAPSAAAAKTVAGTPLAGTSAGYTMYRSEGSFPVVETPQYIVEPSKTAKFFGAEPKLVGESELGSALATTKATDPLTYAPLAVGALTGAFDEPYEAPETEARKPISYPEYSLTGGEERTPYTAEEIRRVMTEGGYTPRYDPYTFERTGTRYAAEGGIVGLQQGGMPTPQAPSAMSSMLTPPVQQPVQPINIAVQPQQPMPMPQKPSMPMTPQQMGSGVTPLPDQQREFMKLMDMEEQVQQQKALQNTGALASILSATGAMGQTPPSGQAVQTPPPMNYGSQVNLGLAGGGQPYFEGQVEGPGDGQSDEVAFRVDGGQVDGAMLSPDEYVLAADVVSAIGNGSSDAGAAKLDQFMKNVRKDAYGTTKQMQPFNNQGLTNLVA